jgi:glycosyltransferase involved in cell wall biosynthesis
VNWNGAFCAPGSNAGTALVQQKIVINGRFLTQRMVGVQRFAIEVTRVIDGLIESGEYAALKGRVEILAPPAARDFPLRHIPVRRCGIGGSYFWEQLMLPFYAHGKLLLNFCSLGPVVTRDQIVVIHDATPKARPQNFTPLFCFLYNFLIPRLCRRALAIGTVSEFSRSELGKWYGADTSKITVCYVGADHISRIVPDHAIIERLGLQGREFFLGVGAGNNKNAETVIAAMQKAGLDDTLLMVTGYRNAKVNGQEVKITSDNLRPTGYVTDEQLRSLMEHALALVSPSRYEGFGLPPVEGMVVGCPAIVSNTPAMVEICGDAALHCDADDIDGLARLLRTVHDDPANRAELIAAGKARAARYTWDATARVLLDLCLAQFPQAANQATNQTDSLDADQRPIVKPARSREKALIS